MPYHADNPLADDVTLQDAVAIMLRQLFLDVPLTYRSKRWDDLPPIIRDQWRDRALEVLYLITSKEHGPRRRWISVPPLEPLQLCDLHQRLMRYGVQVVGQEDERLRRGAAYVSLMLFRDGYRRCGGILAKLMNVA